MIETTEIFPGVTLRCCRDKRFKQGCLSFQFVRLMDEDEAHLNALLPSVMLRATVPHPDLRSITRHLDDLYGASIGPLVRRLGDRQTTGFYCSFLDDRFAMAGDRVTAGMIGFLEEVLTQSPPGKGWLPGAAGGEREEKSHLRHRVRAEQQGGLRHGKAPEKYVPGGFLRPAPAG